MSGIRVESSYNMAFSKVWEFTLASGPFLSLEPEIGNEICLDLKYVWLPPCYLPICLMHAPPLQPPLSFDRPFCSAQFGAIKWGRGPRLGATAQIYLPDQIYWSDKKLNRRQMLRFSIVCHVPLNVYLNVICPCLTLGLLPSSKLDPERKPWVAVDHPTLNYHATRIIQKKTKIILMTLHCTGCLLWSTWKTYLSFSVKCYRFF